MQTTMESNSKRHAGQLADPIKPIEYHFRRIHTTINRYDNRSRDAMAYQKDSVPLVIIGGKEYGSGSSRDWAAKGTLLLGVKAVIAESYERIHRSNLVGMGVLPLQFKPGESATSHTLTGEEVFDIGGLVAGLDKNFDGAFRELTVTATKPDGTTIAFKAVCRIDTPQEVQYYKNGGILPYVLRQLLQK